MDWTRIILAIIAFLGTGLAINLVLKISSKTITQNNNNVKGDIVAGNKVTNNIRN
jgi:hypothetical protein